MLDIEYSSPVGACPASTLAGWGEDGKRNGLPVSDIEADVALTAFGTTQLNAKPLCGRQRRHFDVGWWGRRHSTSWTLVQEARHASTASDLGGWLSTTAHGLWASKALPRVKWFRVCRAARNLSCELTGRS